MQVCIGMQESCGDILIQVAQVPNDGETKGFVVIFQPDSNYTKLSLTYPPIPPDLLKDVNEFRPTYNPQPSHPQVQELKCQVTWHLRRGE